METTVLFPPLSAFVCLAAYADEKYSNYCPTKSVCAISAVCSNLERTLNDFMREKKVKTIPERPDKKGGGVCAQADTGATTTRKVEDERELLIEAWKHF